MDNELIAEFRELLERVAPMSPWLSTEGLAKYLDVSVDTVRAWRYREVGPPGHRMGRHVRYHRDDVDAWVRSGDAGIRGHQ